MFMSFFRPKLWVIAVFALKGGLSAKTFATDLWTWLQLETHAVRKDAIQTNIKQSTAMANNHPRTIIEIKFCIQKLSLLIISLDFSTKKAPDRIIRKSKISIYIYIWNVISKIEYFEHIKKKNIMQQNRKNCPINGDLIFVGIPPPKVEGSKKVYT